MTAAAATGPREPEVPATPEAFRLKAEATESWSVDPIQHAPAKACRRLDVEHLAHRAVDGGIEHLALPRLGARSPSPTSAQTSVYPIDAIFCFSTLRASDTRHFTVPVGIFSICPISS